MNNKLKKALALALSCALTATLLAGCGGNSSSSSSGSSSGSQTSGSETSTPAANELLPYTSKLVEVTADTKSAKDTLVFGSNGAASGCFHPTLQYSNYDREVIFLAFDRLVTKDANGEYVPSLAESYEVSDDATTYTFHLRKDVKWQDGEPFTAEDAAFTYETTCHPDFGKGYDEFSAALVGADAYHEGKADHVEGVKVLDEYTVQFVFKAPYLDAMVKFIDKPVFAKHIWEDTPVGAWGDATELLQNPVGTGPYKLVEFVPDQYVKMVSNPDYFKGEPLIKNFIFKVTNAETRPNEIATGSVDMGEVNAWRPENVQTYIDNAIPVAEIPDANATYLVFDTTDEVLSDVRVRQAILYAIDRQVIVDAMLAGHGSISNAIMKPSLSVYPDGLNEYAYSTEKATELLNAAGWTDTNNDGILDKDGKALHLTYTFSNTTENTQIAQILQQYLKMVGIDLELISQDFNTVLATLKDPTQEFDISTMGATYRANMGYGGSNVWMSRFDKDEKEVALMEAATGSKNMDEAKENYGAWCEYINEMLPQPILYFKSQGYAVNPKLVNYQPIQDEWFADVETWYFEA